MSGLIGKIKINTSESSTAYSNLKKSRIRKTRPEKLDKNFNTEESSLTPVPCPTVSFTTITQNPREDSPANCLGGNEIIEIYRQNIGDIIQNKISSKNSKNGVFLRSKVYTAYKKCYSSNLNSEIAKDSVLMKSSARKFNNQRPKTRNKENNPLYNSKKRVN